MAPTASVVPAVNGAVKVPELPPLSPVAAAPEDHDRTFLPSKSRTTTTGLDVPITPLYNQSEDMDARLAADIVSGLSKTERVVPGPNADDAHFAYCKTLPTMILYDQEGLKIYDELTKEDDYYLYPSELNILAKFGKEIAHRLVGVPTEASRHLSLSLPRNSPARESSINIVELGAGSLRKTAHLLRSMSDIAPKLAPQEATSSLFPVTYHALDLDRGELERTLSALQSTESTPEDTAFTVGGKTIKLGGLWATYDQGLAYVASGGLKQPGASHEGRRVIMWLGSSIGNLDRTDASDMLRRIQRQAMRTGDLMLIGMDRRNDAALVERAYDDRAGWTAKFLMNGLAHARCLLDDHQRLPSGLDPDAFEYVSRYNEPLGRHESYYRSTREQDVVLSTRSGKKICHFEQGELVYVEQSIKFSSREAHETFDAAGLRVVQSWADDAGRYDLWLVEKPPFWFDSTHTSIPAQTPRENGANSVSRNVNRGIPSMEEWEEMWKAWDTVTLTMISSPMMHMKPIDLRHICLFYLGHVPAFVDIFISRMYNEPHLNPQYSRIFERGIDPSMETGETTHTHSEVPTEKDDWPSVEKVVAYERQVQNRIRRVYTEVAQGTRPLRGREARGLWQVFEHIALHMETLLYMLAQCSLTLPPQGFSTPDWAALKRAWQQEDEAQGGAQARQELIRFPGGQVTLGHNDLEADDFNRALPPGPRGPDVAGWNKMLGNPEFGWDIESPENTLNVKPFAVRAGPITNGEYACYLEDLARKGQTTTIPASWVALENAGMEAPMRERYGVKTVYGPVRMSVAELWPVQASGEELEAYARAQGGRLPSQAELRTFLSSPSYRTEQPGTNVGLRNWHPVPARLATSDSDGRLLPAHNGGVWEWTSTPLAAPEGYVASELYPGYSSDFFDGQHWVVLGGSWATTPAIASRNSSVNWYQSPYPYVFAGARVAFDDDA